MIKRLTLNIAVTVVTLCAGVANAANQGILPGLPAYESEKLRPQGPSPLLYMPDGESYIVLSDDHKRIISYETATGKETGTVLDVDKTRNNKLSSVEGFILSPDGRKLLVYCETKPIYRYSFYAKYFVYEIMHNVLTPLSTQHEWQRNPVFSPDGRIVAFVADNNIYLNKLDFGTESAVTTDGKINEIINGVPDWGYDEEFDMNCAMAWAPDNSTLCYLKFNETEVPMFTFPLYGGYCPEYSEYALYPGVYEYKYSLPGEKVSRVTLHSFDIDNRKTKDITLPGTDIEYIPRIYYSPSDPSRLLAVSLNRDQNRMELFAVNPKSTVCRQLLVEEPGAWIIPESYEKIKLYDKSFVMMSPRSGYTHLYEYSYEGQLLRTLTSGNYDVTDYYGCDATGNHYYQSDVTGPLNRVVSRIDTKNKVTDLSPSSGVARGDFSPSCNYFVIDASSSTTPNSYTLYNSKLKKLREMGDNTSVKTRYASVPVKEFIKVPSAASGIELDAYLIKPSNFDPSRKYPLILWQYSGPGAQQVLDSWSIGWEQYAASSEGYIIACVDPRGSGGRGYKFLTTGYKNLGEYETADQIAAGRYLASLPYVDASRVGIAGWSYGGYETLMALSVSDTPFKAGVAIAPVTSWRFYDAIYTERFMLTPSQNPDGYVRSAPVNLAPRINAPLLLMSGTADDNVHFTNTVEYIAQLQRNGKLCDMLIFPNKNHSIYGCNARDLVYSNMLNHFNTYFKK